MSKDRKVVLRHIEVDPMNGPGQKCTRKYNREGGTFIVYCSSKECESYVEDPRALPFVSDDCEIELELLRCPNCNSPVVRPFLG